MVKKKYIKLSGNTSVEHSCSHHANYTLPQPETSVVLCCVTQLHILEWPFIVPSTRCTCVIIMLFYQLLDMPHLSGGWIIVAKEKFSLIGMSANLCTTFERNKLFVRMENFWDLLFQLMKHGTNILHVAFIFFVQSSLKYNTNIATVVGQICVL